MHWEVEQKFRIDPQTVRAKLSQLGIRFEPAIHQVDQYFKHPARDFAKTDEALRLRQLGERNFVTYKGPKIDLETKTRRELELPLPDGQAILTQFVELLLALGFSPAGTVRKARQAGNLSWQGQNVELALDEVENLGPFLELEIVATDETLEMAKSDLLGLALELNLPGPERRSYLELILEKIP